MNKAVQTKDKFIRQLYERIFLFSELKRLRIEFPTLKPGSHEQFENLNKTKTLLEIAERMRENWI